MNTEDSRSISMLRFPMAVLVILLHSDVICQSKNTLIYNNGIGEFMITLCSNGVCQLAVPCFALISGYLFFGGLKDFSWPIWTEKIRRRVHTLLIPYVLWNTLALLWMVAYGYILHICRGVDFSLSTVWNDVGGGKIFMGRMVQPACRWTTVVHQESDVDSYLFADYICVD